MFLTQNLTFDKQILKKGSNLSLNRYKPGKKKFALGLSWPFLASSVAAPNLTLPQLRIEIINYYYYRYLHKKNMAFVAKGSSHKGRQSF